MKRKYDRIRVRGKIIRLRKRLQKPADAGQTVFGALKSPGSHVRDGQCVVLVPSWSEEDEARMLRAIEKDKKR